jgi:ribosomal protein S27E
MAREITAHMQSTFTGAVECPRCKCTMFITDRPLSLKVVDCRICGTICSIIKPRDELGRELVPRVSSPGEGPAR